MTEPRFTRVRKDSQCSIPTVMFDEAKALAAWEAHSRLLHDMIEHPSLRHNPVWTMLRQDAYEQLCAAYGSVA